MEVVALLLNGWVGHITGQRILASLGGLVASIVGMLLIVALPLSNDVGRLIGYYLTQASPTPFVALLSLISSNVAGYTKKTTVAALYLIGYCAGNIIGEWIHNKKTTPTHSVISKWWICGWVVGTVWILLTFYTHRSASLPPSG